MATKTTKTLSVETIASNFADNVSKQLVIKGKAGAIILDQVRLIIGMEALETHTGLKKVDRVHITPEAIKTIQTAYIDATSGNIAESTQSQYKAYISGILRAVKDDKRALVEQALNGCKSPQNAYKALNDLIKSTGSNGPNDPASKIEANQAPEASGESVDKQTTVDDSKASVSGFDCTVRGCSDDDFIVEKLYLKLSRDGGPFGVRTIAKKLEAYAQHKIASHALLDSNKKAS